MGVQFGLGLKPRIKRGEVNGGYQHEGMEHEQPVAPSDGEFSMVNRYAI